MADGEGVEGCIEGVGVGDWGEDMKQTREDIITELGNMVKKHSNTGISHKLSYTMKRWELELVTDFILAYRKRIVEPLVKYINGDREGDYMSVLLFERVTKTLHNAGIEDK